MSILYIAAAAMAVVFILSIAVSVIIVLAPDKIFGVNDENK